MHMIRHDAPSDQLVCTPVAVCHHIAHDLGNTVVAEPAGAPPGIEQLLNSLGVQLT
jgi:hypothetical protein